MLMTGMLGIGGCAPTMPSDAPYPDCCAGEITIARLQVQPLRVTVLAGAGVTFSAQASGFSGSIRYQWRRSQDGGATWADLPGATGSTYTLAATSLADDGAMFQAWATSDGSTAFDSARLSVSAHEGLIFEDGEFDPSHWSVTPFGDSAVPAPVQTSGRVVTGGNPGAYRKMVFVIPPQQGVTPDSLGTARVLWSSNLATYDPLAQGAIHVIDYTEDGIWLSGESVYQNAAYPGTAGSALLIEQAGRTYIAQTWRVATPQWRRISGSASLLPGDFELIAGIACRTGESCPDFSTSGLPIRFGYYRVAFGFPGDAVAHGMDNWKVTVWRK